MNPPKCNELDYINFLVAAQQVFSSIEASRTHPTGETGPAHDAYTRLLQRLPPDSQALWQEVESWVERAGGVLVLDDTTLDKPYASKMALVTRHWSGKHRRVVQGINLISLVWTDRICRLPCDFRLYNKAQDGLSKNDHFQHILQQARERDFEWDWLTQLKSNRLVSIDRSGNRPISQMLIQSEGCMVHLKGYGWVKVFKTVGTNGDFEYWATSRLGMTIEQAAFHALDAWQIEVYHRGLKQFTGIERGQYRVEVSQRNHIGLAIRAFVRLEIHRRQTGMSWFEAKSGIIRAAIRDYLAHPAFTLCSTA